MDAIKNITHRSSARELKDPHPSQEEMHTIFEAALRAPDHAWLRPSRFIQIAGASREKLSKIFLKTAEELNPNLSEIQIEKYTNAPYRAPMIIVLVSKK